jgi:hypothetical protein
MIVPLLSFWFLFKLKQVVQWMIEEDVSLDDFSNPTWWSLSSLMERILVNDLITEIDNSILIMEGQKYDYDRVKTLSEDQFYIKGHEII